MRRALLVLAAFFVLAAPAAAKTTKPTIVLVHGAFADASGWNGVTERLQDRGYTVLAPANPLRGVSADAAYLKNVLSHVSGPIVLVGHSYGGVAITNAATGNPNVKALVYVAAFVPAQGDTVQTLSTPEGGAQLGPDKLDILPDGTPEGLEATIKVSAFRDVFAADVPRKLAAVMAASQRPASLVTLGEPSGAPAWASSRPGRSSRPRTTRSAPATCARWPSGRRPRSPRSRAPPTWSWSRSRASTADVILRAAKGK